MSDLSKIKVGSTTYDIKDAVAREEFGNYLPTIDPIVEVNPENYNTASLYFKDDKTAVNLWDGEPDSGRSLGVSISQDSNAEHPVTLYLGSSSADFQTGSSIILDSDGEIKFGGETYSITNPSAFRNALGITNFGTLYGVCSTGASTAAKTVTINGLNSYEEGITIFVLFLAPHTSSTAPTLNVNSLGAKAIAHGIINGSAQPMQTWPQGSVISLTYVKIGATYVWMVNDYQENTDTKNTAGSNQDTAQLYLVGAKSQTTGSNGVQTYSNANVYEQNGGLHADSFNGLSIDSEFNGTGDARLSTGTCSITIPEDETYTLGDACEAGIDTSISSGSTSTNLPTTQAVADYVQAQIVSSSGDNGVDPEIVVGSTQPTNTNARIWIIP